MYKNIIKSLAIILAISTTTSGGFSLLGCNFWGAFIVITIGQFLLWYVVELAFKMWAAIEQERLTNQRIESFSKQSMQVKCPCSTGAVEVIPIRLDQINTYKCSTCNKNINVTLNPTTAIQTDMIDTQQNLTVVFDDAIKQNRTK
jgi:hypothetical protein